MFTRRSAKVDMGRGESAGLIASIAIAIAGVVLGAVAAFLGEFGAGATAASRPEPAGAPTAFVIKDRSDRDRIVKTVIENAPPGRLPAPPIRFGEPAPKIIIVLDDMGGDPALSKRALALPGPLTYAFLPYAAESRRLAAEALADGDEVLLHLPMEPVGNQDPGPFALRTGMTGTAFIETLEWNLDRLDGYVGVNNHMGSKLTANAAAMKTVLAYLKARDLFFLDSVTTGATAVRASAKGVGADILSRDVFLDAAPGDLAQVRDQLRLAEQIARETGYVIAIGHPRQDTLAALGPWLASAKARGFELATPSSLINERKEQVLAIAAPDLRL